MRLPPPFPHRSEILTLPFFSLHRYRTPIFVCIWLSIAVLIGGVVMLSLKKPPPAPRERSGSTASTLPNPFDDPSSSAVAYELDSPIKPGFVRATTGASEVDVEAGRGGRGAEEEQPRRKGQGWLSRLFGGLPSDPPAAPSASLPATRAGPAQPPRRGRNTDGDGDSVLASERASQRGAEELEMDEVDGLEDYGAGFKGGQGREEEEGDDEDDDFGEFEKATGAVRVDEAPDRERRGP